MKYIVKILWTHNVRILLIEKWKNSKTIDFKTVNMEKIASKIVKLKVWWMVVSLRRRITYFKIISNQQSATLGVSEFEK